MGPDGLKGCHSGISGCLMSRTQPLAIHDRDCPSPRLHLHSSERPQLGFRALEVRLTIILRVDDVFEQQVGIPSSVVQLTVMRHRLIVGIMMVSVIEITIGVDKESVCLDIAFMRGSTTTTTKECTKEESDTHNERQKNDYVVDGQL